MAGPGQSQAPGISAVELMRIAEMNQKNAAVAHPTSAEGGHHGSGGHFGFHISSIEDVKFHGNMDLGHGGEAIHIFIDRASSHAFNHNLFEMFDGCFAPVVIGQINELSAGIKGDNLSYGHEIGQVRAPGLPSFHNTDEHFRGHH